MAAFAVLSSEKVYIRGVGGTQFNNLMVFMSHMIAFLVHQ